MDINLNLWFYRVSGFVSLIYSGYLHFFTAESGMSLFYLLVSAVFLILEKIEVITDKLDNLSGE